MIPNQIIEFYHQYHITNLKQNPESQEYSACSFELNDKKVQYRTSKITPTKIGQFVTTWKRNSEGITAPFDSTDNLDYIIITSTQGDNHGQFIFPIAVLAEKGIVTHNGKSGKRGIRVYPPWDRPTSKQAIKTQAWQIKYFVNIDTGNPFNSDTLNRLLT